MAASKDKKVFDVSKPGKTAAASSGRPLIIGHKPMLKDPMVKDGSTNELDEGKEVKIDQPIEEDIPSGSPPTPSMEEQIEKSAAEAVAPSESKITIQPIDDNISKDEKKPDDKPTEEPKADTATEEPTAPVLPEAVAASDEPEEGHKVAVRINKSSAKPKKDSNMEPTPKTAKAAGVASATKTEDKVSEAKETDDTKEESKPNTSDNNSDKSESNNDTESNSEKSSNDNQSTDKESTSTDENPETDSAALAAQKKAELAAQAEAAKKEQIEKMVTSKQYYVPIGEKTRKRRSIKHILIGALLIILFGGALLYLMADVGIIKTGYTLPYHFFKQNTVSESNTSPPATPPKAPAAPTKKSTDSSVLVIKEWNMKMPLTTATKDVKYSYDKTNDTVALTTPKIDSLYKQDVGCMTGPGPLERIKASDIKTLQGFQSKTYTDVYVKVGNYYVVRYPTVHPACVSAGNNSDAAKQIIVLEKEIDTQTKLLVTN